MEIVKHLPKPTSILYQPDSTGDLLREPSWPDDFRPVARVSTGDLLEVFAVTQGVDLSKEEASLVRWLRPARSMSVGDVIMIRYCELYLCKSDGWKRIATNHLYRK